MNAITRVVGVRPNFGLHGINITFANLLISLLVLSVMLSAFGVVYFKDLNRRMFINYQNQLQMRQQYEIEWGKLLLEESAWSTQARVQQIAQDQLNMEVPQQSDVVLIQD